MGEQYLVYAFVDNELLVTTACDEPESLEKAAEGLKELGEGAAKKEKARVSLVTWPPNNPSEADGAMHVSQGIFFITVGG